MPDPHAPTIGPLAGALRSLGRLFGARKVDPLETRLTHAGSAGTPLTEDEAVDIAAARAEIRRGESTTDPLGPAH